jgi:hypothetical protein
MNIERHKYLGRVNRLGEWHRTTSVNICTCWWGRMGLAQGNSAQKQATVTVVFSGGSQFVQVYARKT